MFQFAGFPSIHYGFMHGCTGCAPCGFPHSDTCGSPGMCPSPQLFAACRVFLRPLVPRHPPCAFLCLTFLGCIALQPLFPFLGRNSPVFLFTACSCLFVSRLSWFPHLLCFHHSVLYEVFKVHAFFCKPRQPPAFPCRPRHSILGRLRLNHRVRDGYGCFP